MANIFLYKGSYAGGVSSTAAATATSGTITTANVATARVTPAAAVTGVILQAGTVTGQEVTVLNEAVAANTVTFAVSGTSNVADGVSRAIPGLTAVAFVWDGTTSLWYRKHAVTVPTVSATAVATATSGTIATAALDVSRVSPVAAITGVILAAGTASGQNVTVINEATGANSVTFAVAGTSNVANGTSTVIAGLTAATFVWDAGTSLWYHRV